MTAITERDMQSLVGHEFPGGTYRLHRWENAMLCHSMCAEPDPAGGANLLFLTYAAIAGLGVRLGDLLELLRVEPEHGVQNGESRIEIVQSLRVETEYRMSGRITSIERKESRTRGVMDVVTIRTEAREQDVLAAVMTMTLLVYRGRGQA